MYILTLRRELKELENMKIADDLLAEETYTLEDLLDPATKYFMLRLTDEERAEFIKQKKIEVRCKNLIPCIVLGKEKLNGMDTYQYAERKGLTKDMTHEQKQILERVSNDVSFWRILSITQKYLTLVIGIMAISNFVVYSKFQELYDKIQPEENYIFWGLVAVILFVRHKGKKKFNNIVQQMYNLAQSQEK